MPRVANLTAAEVADMWQLAQDVGTCMEAEFKADALTLAIQVAATTYSHTDRAHCSLTEMR